MKRWKNNFFGFKRNESKNNKIIIKKFNKDEFNNNKDKPRAIDFN